MPLKVGFLGVAHMHAYGYAGALRRQPDACAEAVWEPDAAAAANFGKTFDTTVVGSPEELVSKVDAVIVTSQNNAHLALVKVAAEAGKPVLCEKPLVANSQDADAILDLQAKTGMKLMTAFPCRYASAFKSVRSKVQQGAIGDVKAVCATNHGMCPFGWFVEKDHSGGGAMIDHTVHVADLMWHLFHQEAVSVFAQTGNCMYGQDWEDTAMLTIGYEGGLFATLDSSWSRPKPFKTWGDVTMTLVGSDGVLEMDMFNQAVDVYHEDMPSFSASSYGSDMDAGLVEDFLRMARGEIESPIPASDGVRAARIALAGYQSVQTGKPVAP